MSIIHWYPGHMHKAQKEMRQVFSHTDVFIEVLDARIPFSSENPLIESIRADKPCIKILNKADLADPAMLTQWQNYFDTQKNIQTLALNLSSKHKVQQIPELCRKLAGRSASNVKKVRAMIAGIPNVGKSTLINRLVGRTIAKTGNEPAVTKRQQKIALGDDIILMDTPGILWPRQEFINSGFRLAATGAIRDTAMEYDDVAFFLAQYLLTAYPKNIAQRYNMDLSAYTHAIDQSCVLSFFECLGKKKGCLSRGGRVDLNKISELLVKDFRAGYLGAICLETPEMVAQEKAEQSALAEEKRQKKKTMHNKKY